MIDYGERVQRAIDFIENHITEEIELEDIAKRAYSSLFHFHRIFQAVIGDSMKEYIRKRRLSLAGRELAGTDIKVIDLALKYGYETPEAFAKAFKKMHGITPIECRRLRGPFVFRERATASVYVTRLLEEGVIMNYKIIEKGEIRLIGRELRVRNDNGDNFKLIPEFWLQCMQEGIYEKFGNMPNRVNPKDNVVLGICMDFDGVNTFTYVIGTEVSNIDYVPEGMSVKVVPASKYAVFTAKGIMPEAIQQTWKDIYGKWFPASGYERTDGPDFEWYDTRSQVNDENAEVDIYIPIK